MARSFIIERDALLEAARAASRPVEARNTIPILANVLIDVKADALTVRGSDLEISVETSAACQCAEPFATTVSSVRLIAAIETLRSAGIVVTEDKGKVTIKQDRAVRTLMSLPAADFPVVKVGNVATEFTMEGKDLLALLESTRCAMSSEETRYYLCGVFLHVRDGQLVCAATDGNRLMKAVSALPDGAAGMPDTIISSKSVNLLVAMLAAAEGAQVQVRVGDRSVEAVFARARMVLKIVDGTYPEYTRVIPSNNPKVLKVHAAEMSRALRAAAAMADAKSRCVKLALSSKQCAILSTGYDGHVDEPLDGEFGPGDLEVGLNASLAKPMLDAFGEAAGLEVAFLDPAAPVLITSPARPALSGVIMPMRV